MSRSLSILLLAAAATFGSSRYVMSTPVGVSTAAVLPCDSMTAKEKIAGSVALACWLGSGAYVWPVAAPMYSDANKARLAVFWLAAGMGVLLWLISQIRERRMAFWEFILWGGGSGVLIGALVWVLYAIAEESPAVAQKPVAQSEATNNRTSSIPKPLAVQNAYLDPTKLAAEEPITYTYEVKNIGQSTATLIRLRSLLFVGDRLEKVKGRMDEFAKTVVDREFLSKPLAPNDPPYPVAITWEGRLSEDEFKIISSKTDHSKAISLGVVMQYEDSLGDTYRVWRCFRYRYSDNRWINLEDGCGGEKIIPQ